MIAPIIRSSLVMAQSVYNITHERVYFGQRPQGDIDPAIVIHTISDVSQQNMTGSDWAKARFQINCIASTYRAAYSLAQVVRDTLQHKNGSFYHIEANNLRDLAPSTTKGQDTPIFSTAVDVTATYRNSTN